MRDNLERVTIVLTKEQHQRFKEYSKRYHGSLSQFLRMAGENEADENNGSDMLNLRPIIKKLEMIGSIVQQMDERLKRTESGTNYVVDKLGSKIEKVAEDIAELLLHKGQLSIPEMGNYLPHTQEEIISGVEKLEGKFAIIRIEQLTAPSKWKIRGDGNAN